MIALAAPHLARHELARVLQDPADRRLVELGDGLVLLGPGDRPLGGVDVRHLGAGAGRDQRGGTGVGKEIEHARGLAAHALPASRSIHCQCGSCSGKRPRWRKLVSRHSTVTPSTLQRPGLRHRRVLAPAPALAVLLVAAALEDGVGPQPHARLQRRLPHRLRLGPVDREAAEALELAPVAAVEQRVVGKARRGDHAQRRWSGAAGRLASLARTEPAPAPRLLLSRSERHPHRPASSLSICSASRQSDCRRRTGR